MITISLKPSDPTPTAQPPPKKNPTTPWPTSLGQPAPSASLSPPQAHDIYSMPISPPCGSRRSLLPVDPGLPPPQHAATPASPSTGVNPDRERSSSPQSAPPLLGDNAVQCFFLCRVQFAIFCSSVRCILVNQYRFVVLDKLHVGRLRHCCLRKVNTPLKLIHLLRSTWLCPFSFSHIVLHRFFLPASCDSQKWYA